MIIFFLLFMAVVLIFLGIVLLKKTLFYSLIPETDDNHRFLHRYGIVFILLGIISVSLISINQKLITLFFIAIMLLVSALFSIQFAKKMTK
uniref:hypothetical protein n=1 Tax=Candidatus Enterococcus willemsii TaxID=1857215 RepID=UPI00403F1FC3